MDPTTRRSLLQLHNQCDDMVFCDGSPTLKSAKKKIKDRKTTGWSMERSERIQKTKEKRMEWHWVNMDWSTVYQDVCGRNIGGEGERKKEYFEWRKTKYGRKNYREWSESWLWKIGKRLGLEEARKAWVFWDDSIFRKLKQEVQRSLFFSLEKKVFIGFCLSGLDTGHMS